MRRRCNSIKVRVRGEIEAADGADGAGVVVQLRHGDKVHLGVRVRA